jgi:hypothetical protein
VITVKNAVIKNMVGRLEEYLVRDKVHLEDIIFNK